MTMTNLRTATAAALRSSETPVRGCTVKMPHAAAIAHWGKTPENRSRVSAYTGLVIMTASKRPDTAALRDTPAGIPGLHVRGAAIAVVRMTGCHKATACGGTCTRWARAGDDIWHWELTDHLPLADPVPATGYLALWHPTRQLRHQVADALLQEPAR